jgi:glutathionylspermidine synthase
MSLLSNTYQEQRKEFFDQYPFFWANANENEEFALFGYHYIERSLFDDVKKATNALGEVYKKAGSFLRTVSDDVLIQLGVPANAVNIARHTIEGMGDTVIGRFDYAITPDNKVKMMEFNADTPTFIVETFYMNKEICDHLNVYDPNMTEWFLLSNALYRAIAAGIKYVGKDANLDEIHVAFSAFGWHQEDRETMHYLMSNVMGLAKNIKVSFVSIEDWQVSEDGLFDKDGKKIDVVYRLYPIEYLSEDINEEGVHIGELLFQLVEQQKLAIINPPSAFLIQSKAVQAVIWGLRGNRDFFSVFDHWAIETYMLPTYIDPITDRKYVAKAVLGREGNTVTIIDPVLGETINTDNYDYLDQPTVYQEYVQLPTMVKETEAGTQELSYMLACFLIGGEASAVGIRAGGLITNNTSYFIPVTTNP